MKSYLDLLRLDTAGKMDDFKISTSSAQGIKKDRISEDFTNLDLCNHCHEVVILLLWSVNFELRTSPPQHYVFLCHKIGD